MSLTEDRNRRRPPPLEVLRGTIDGVRSDQITFIAASLAYYAFVSLLPLLLLGIVAASVLGGERLAFALATRASNVFGPEAGTLVTDALTDTVGQAGASLVGVTFLAWSGLKLFRGLKIAFATVYGSSTESSFLDQLRDAVVALVAVGMGVLVTVAAGIALALIEVDLLPWLDLADLLATPLLVAGLTAAFLPLYYLLPDVSLPVREALPGAVLAAGGWTLLQFGFRFYAANASATQVYGVLGAVLLIVTFLYFGGLILLVGVVFNAVLADRIDRGGVGSEDSTGPGVTTTAMTDDTDERTTGSIGTGDDGGDTPGRRLSDSYDGDVEAELERLYDELERFESRFEDNTVHREEIEGELKRYVRARVRRGKATGWGPYLVLLYGTAMTLGAFFFLSGGWAILAMLVVWLSTLGLYTLMILVGLGVSAAGVPGRIRERVSAFRD